MPTDAMIDLETLDVSPEAVVLTVGGVKFNPFTTDEPHSEFYYRLTIDDQEANGRKINPDTLEWWGNQDNAIIEEAFGEEGRVSADQMLQDLKKWFVGCNNIWAQGIGFDITMLENMMQQYDRPCPWKFWQVEDSRTLLNRMPTDPRKSFTFAAHNALEDARIQAKAVQMTYKHFGFTR